MFILFIKKKKKKLLKLFNFKVDHLQLHQVLQLCNKIIL